MTADPKKAARAALYVARKTFAGGGNAVQPFDISRENRISTAQTNLGVGSEVTYGNQNAPSYRKVGSETRELPIGGSLSGSEGIIPASHKAPLEGLPSRVKIPLTGEVITAEPNHLIRSVAEKYMLDSGGSYNPPQKYAKVDAVRAKRIADEYERMADDPGHPLVKASYDAMINETMAQYRAAKAAGFKAEFWDPEKERDPYEASPRLAIDDVNKNHHMYVFPTYFGYGSKEIPADAMQKNPLLADSGERWNGHIVTINDIFRAVHDYFGHAKEGVGFRHDGEENAWRSHASMYSPLARLAMTTETRGQNSWLNFGPYGEKNRNAKTEDTVFAPQKIGVMAPWTTHEGAEDFLRPQDREAMEEAYNQYRKAHFSAGGATDDDAFTAYHGTPHEFEPEPDAPYGRFRDTAIGSGEGAQAFGYGHYLAGNEGIAKSYRDALSGDLITHEGERPIWQNRGSKSFAKLALMQSFDKKLSGDEAIRDAMQDLHRNAAFSERKDIKQRYYDAVNSLSSMLGKQWKIDPGHILETRVRAKPEHFLDWDKPLSEQHPHVQKALESFGFKADPAGMRAHDDALLAALHGSGPESAIPRQPNDPTGKEIHRKLVGGASEWGETKQGAIETAKDLHAAGIPGIRYLDASSRGPTGAPTHNYVVFDPKNIDIVKRYAQGGEVYSNHAPRHTMQSPAVAELKHLLTMHRDELRSMKGRTQYAAIDGIMKRISHEHGIAPSKLHNDWMSVYHQTPDAWVAGDHGNVVDRALKMTSRGGYAFGGSPAGFASATGAPINFAPAAGAFTGLPSPETLNLAPSKATLAAILASRPTTHTGSGKPVELSRYVPPSIAAPTFNASSYNLPDNPLEEGQGGSGDRWHPNGGGAPTGGTVEITAAAPLGGGYGDSDSDAAARGGRIHRADGGEAGYKETPFQHIEKRSPGWGASWTPLHEVSQKLGGIKKISESASNYGDFMNVMAHKAKNDQLSPRDLIKSYLMTVSSQGRQAVNPQTILKNWPDYPGPIHDKIRPEGAMGEWLLSPIGKRYLDAAEQGIVDHGAISHALKSFGGFGKINNAEGKALPWAAQSLVPHTKIVSNMIAASLEGRHSAEDWRNWVKNNIHGVGFAKSGFWGSMLGRGDQSVPDARQLVLHTPNKNDEATSLIGVGGGVPASQREGEAMKRIIDRQNALGLSISKELSPHYQALAHHTIWDAAGGTDTTHQDVINAMKHAASGGAIDGDNEHPVAMIFKALGMPGLERGDKQTTHQDVINAMRHAATGGAIEDPAHNHPLAQAMAEIGLPMGDSRIHRADGGEIPQEILNRIVSPFSGNEEQVKRALEIAQGYKTPIGNAASGQTGAYYSIKHPMGASEVSTKIKDIPGVALSPKREMSWEDLYKEGQGGSFINVGGDRSNLGRLTHINNKKLAWPIDLHAGAKYMMEPNPGSVWANNVSHATGFRNAILRAAEKGPVYGIYAPMGPMSVDSSHNMFDAVMAQIPGSNISKENIQKFNDDIKEARHLPANDPDKERVKEIMGKWPGLENPKEASLFARSIGGVHRAAIIKHMDKASWHKLGFPAIGMTRAAITDPEVFNAPGNVIGHRVVKFNPENIVGKETAMPHSTYTHPTSGEYVGDIPLVQRHYAMPDVIEQIVRKVTKKGQAIHPYSIDPNGRSAFRKMTEENRQIQPINQRMLDSTQLGLKRQSDYGLKNGGSAKSLVDIALNLTKGKK